MLLCHVVFVVVAIVHVATDCSPLCSTRSAYVVVLFCKVAPSWCPLLGFLSDAPLLLALAGVGCACGPNFPQSSSAERVYSSLVKAASILICSDAPRHSSAYGPT
jgi:hypothetical protein